MKTFLLRLAILGVILGIFGGLVFVSGIVPIAASSGHWPITEWFLQFGKSRSVATHSMGAKPPRPLDDAALILQGAGHYETACRSCHGSPGSQMPRVPQGATPKPPYLPHRTPAMSDAEIFYIIKHGIKFTGMPAWPAPQRDDEVWAMTAFIRELETLDKARYEELTGIESSTAAITALEMVPSGPAGRALAQSCARCHGADGLSRGNPAIPRLAGQKAVYLANALHAYKGGQRASGMMEPVAAALDAGAIEELAAYYAALPPGPPWPADASATEAQLQLGEQIYHQGGEAQRGVPSCVDCHGHAGDAAQVRPEYPILAGQPADYVANQLRLLQKKQRGGSSFHHLMHPIADVLKEEEITALAAYIQTLPAPSRD